VKRKRQPTDGDQLAAYAVRLLEITAELQPYGERALNLSRDEAWDIRTELLNQSAAERHPALQLVDGTRTKAKLPRHTHDAIASPQASLGHLNVLWRGARPAKP
jgi:hypothetical protein